MLRQCENLCLIIFIFSIFSTLSAQDSLYLVGSITGVSTEKKITNISRVGDVNGDGYDDFTVSSRTGKTRSDQGIVQLFLGSATLDLIPDVTFHYPCCDTLNYLGNANELGDVNGDGYDDFMLTGGFGDFGFSKGKVFLYYGGETIDTVPAAEFYEPWIQDGFGGVVVKLDDLNKDGYDDFSISSTYNWDNGKGYVYLFWGGDTITWNKSITFTSNIVNDFFGESVTNIGDVNSDGFKDIAIGAPAGLLMDDTSKVYFYYGGFIIDTTKDYILNGGSIYNIGDINLDNKVEFIFYNGKINIYSGLDSLISFSGYLNSSSYGDLNKDGYDDFIIGKTNYRNSDSMMVGGAYVYFGKPNIDTTFNLLLEGENKWDEFSKIITSEDINSDGFDELFVLSPNFPDYTSPKGKVYIYSRINFTDIKDLHEKSKLNFHLYQNFPNPFNPTTNIQFSVSSREYVQLKVYDILGKEIAILVNEEKPAGKYEVNFNASSLASGVYIYKIQAGGFVSSKKMILLK